MRHPTPTPTVDEDRLRLFVHGWLSVASDSTDLGLGGESRAFFGKAAQSRGFRPHTQLLATKCFNVPPESLPLLIPGRSQTEADALSLQLLLELTDGYSNPCSLLPSVSSQEKAAQSHHRCLRELVMPSA